MTTHTYNIELPACWGYSSRRTTEQRQSSTPSFPFPGRRIWSEFKLVSPSGTTTARSGSFHRDPEKISRVQCICIMRVCQNTMTFFLWSREQSADTSRAATVFDGHNTPEAIRGKIIYLAPFFFPLRSVSTISACSFLYFQRQRDRPHHAYVIS